MDRTRAALERRPIDIRNIAAAGWATEGVPIWRALATPAVYEDTPEGEPKRRERKRHLRRRPGSPIQSTLEHPTASRRVRTLPSPSPQDVVPVSPADRPHAVDGHPGLGGDFAEALGIAIPGVVRVRGG
jgi:hypothetical protein